jgi:cytochrome b561
MSGRAAHGPALTEGGSLALRGDSQGFGLVARAIHWFTLPLLLAGYLLVWFIDWVPAGPDRVQFVSVHRTLGLIVLALTLLRLVWRGVDRRPPLEGGRWSRLAARAVHGLIYAALLVIPLMGWGYTNAKGHVLKLFGMSLPSLVFKDEYFSRVTIDVHEWVAYGLLGVLAMHMAAALWHHFWLRDHTLVAMARGRSRPS